MKPDRLTFVMLEVSRELKIHYDDKAIPVLNTAVMKRMIELDHPNAIYMDEIGRLPDKAPMDVTFRNDYSGQPPQFEEKEVVLPEHLAAQIGYVNK